MKKILMVIGIMILFLSCKEEIPAFPNELKRYLPYKDGDVVLYISDNNDTIQFVARDIYLSDKHKHSFGCKCGNITELNGYLISETLHVEYTVICNESFIDIDVFIENDGDLLNTFSNRYSYNAYAENIASLIGDVIIMQCNNGDSVTLMRDNGIMCFYIDKLKYKKVS